MQNGEITQAGSFVHELDIPIIEELHFCNDGRIGIYLYALDSAREQEAMLDFIPTEIS